MFSLLNDCHVKLTQNVVCEMLSWRACTHIVAMVYHSPFTNNLEFAIFVHLSVILLLLVLLLNLFILFLFCLAFVTLAVLCKTCLIRHIVSGIFTWVLNHVLLHVKIYLSLIYFFLFGFRASIYLYYSINYLVLCCATARLYLIDHP